MVQGLVSNWDLIAVMSLKFMALSTGGLPTGRGGRLCHPFRGLHRPGDRHQVSRRYAPEADMHSRAAQLFGRALAQL